MGWRGGETVGPGRAPMSPAAPPRGFPLRGLPTGLPGPSTSLFLIRLPATSTRATQVLSQTLFTALSVSGFLEFSQLYRALFGIHKVIKACGFSFLGKIALGLNHSSQLLQQRAFFPNCLRPDFPAVLQRWPRECPPPKPFLVPPAVSLPPSLHRLVYRRCYPSPTLSSGLDSEDPAVSWPCTSPAQGFTSQIPNTLAGPGLSDSALRSWITRDKHGCVINDLNEHSLLL